MPSIHVAMAMIFMLTGWRAKKLLGIVLTLYALIMQIGSILLAWHYAIDGYITIVFTILIWKVIGELLERCKDINSEDSLQKNG